MIEISVNAGAAPYSIRIGRGVLDAPDWLKPLAPAGCLALTDANVWRHQGPRLLAASGLSADEVLVLTPGEPAKALATVARIWDWMAARRLSRDGVLVAFGGGVIGDLAGFAAATWMRGIDFVQVPTTLLAMVDSAVGGKTGINLAAGKNLVGAFHQPRAVLADLANLDTLPRRELAAGLAEVVKYGAIRDAEFFTWLEAHAEALCALDPAALGEAIRVSLGHKAQIVERDPLERGERALLNFGHSFGHALEVEGNYVALLHGEAVAIGMLLAARLSARLGMADAADTARLATLLKRLGLATVTPASMQPERLLARMRLDKKNTREGLRLILWRGIGRAEIVSGVDPAQILAILGE